MITNTGKPGGVHALFPGRGKAREQFRWLCFRPCPDVDSVVMFFVIICLKT
jgi:hypothetical protein